MRLTSAAAIVAFSCLAGPAVAGWGEAEWGMSIEEVERVIDGARPLGNGMADRLEADYEALGLPGGLGFIFMDGSLAEVNFSPDDASECDGLEDRAYSIYGEPNIVEQVDILRSKVWTDPDRANLVQFQLFTSPQRQCALSYYPLPAPGVDGGI